MKYIFTVFASIVFINAAWSAVSHKAIDSSNREMNKAHLVDLFPGMNGKTLADGRFIIFGPDGSYLVLGEVAPFDSTVAWDDDLGTVRLPTKDRDRTQPMAWSEENQGIGEVQLPTKGRDRTQPMALRYQSSEPMAVNEIMALISEYLSAHPEVCENAGLSGSACREASEQLAGFSPGNCPPGTPLEVCLKLIKPAM